MNWLQRLAELFGGKRRGLVRLRDTLSLFQAAIAVIAVAWAQSASLWAVALTVLLATWAMIRKLPETSTRTAQTLWTLGIVMALVASGMRAFLTENELLVAGVDFFLLMIVQRLFNRQRSREHMQLLMLGSVLMVIAAVIDAELHYPVLLALYLPTASFALIINHLVSEGERLGRRVEFEVDRYGSRELSRLGRAAVSVAVGAAVAGLVTFLVFPRFGAGVFLRGNLYGNDSVGFSDSVQLGGFGTIKTDATVVMHINPLDESPLPTRLTWHLRGSAFDSYENGRWGRSGDALPGKLDRKLGYYLVNEDGQLPGTPTIAPLRYGGTLGQTIDPRRIPDFAASNQTARALVTMEDIGTDLLFGAGRPIAFALTPRGPLEERNRLAIDVDNQVRVLNRSPGPIQYEFVSRVGEPDRNEMQRVGDPAITARLSPYVARAALTPAFRELALEITEGADTRLEKAEAVRAYLLKNYSYSLDQPLSARVQSGELDPIEGFLYDTRSGHCEYFATAMALLLREVDVPTRNVNGFYGAHYNAIGEFYAVRQADAHSWVEVYFEDLGWVTFDPTPPAGRTAGDNAPWFPGLSNIADALRDTYLEYVIDYDLDAQLDMLEQIGVQRSGYRFEIDWRQLAPYLGGLGGLAFIVITARRLWRRRKHPNAPEIEIYAKLLEAMSKRERGRLEHESARAWALRLAEQQAPEADAMHAFAQAYDGLRFAPERPSPAMLIELERLARAVLER